MIVVNYANTDMVGHTGDLAAAIKAVEAVDHCLGRLAEAVDARRRRDADHRRSRQCRDDARPEDRPAAYRAHHSTPCRCVLVNPPAGVAGIGDGKLADIAPTLLALLGLAAAARP